ncbi:MAG: vitamin K epoxide reductase family protein [Anaerolineales bacterium]|jgi:uncharacterized membrane protein
MKRSIILLTLTLLLLAAMPVEAQTPIVRAVLFYSPFCGHCHKVINEDIPPLSAQYNKEVIWAQVPEETSEETGGAPTFVALEGDALQILFVNATTQIGGELFKTAIETYGIPEPVGVPLLIVAGQYLIGSADIPSRFPDIIAAGLDSGGIAWPEIPGLQEHIADLVPIEEQNEQGTTPTAEAVNPEGNTEQEQAGSTEELENTDVLPPAQQPDLMGVNISRLSVRERVLLDPVGNTLSILVLIGMLLSIVGIAARWRTGPGREAVQHLHGYHLILILLGIGVAAYLTFVESTDTLAVCGPVGDCNTVQQSGYALLFGLLPVGVLGLVGYTGLLIAWSIARSGRGQSASFATIGFFALALLGTLFSIYLTFLEPFVIGATCMWCLSSAVIMTALTILSTDPARSAFQAWRSQEGGTKAG